MTKILNITLTNLKKKVLLRYNKTFEEIYKEITGIPFEKKTTEKLVDGKKFYADEEELNWSLIEKLCAIFCTSEEVAALNNISNRQLYKRIKSKYGVNWREYYQKHSAKGKASLRRRQFKVAVEDDNVQMLIHLGKSYLDQNKENINNNILINSSIEPIKENLIEQATTENEKQIIKDISEMTPIEIKKTLDKLRGSIDVEYTDINEPIKQKE